MNPKDEGRCTNNYQQVNSSGGIKVPVKGVKHRFYVEELVCNFSDKQLTYDDDSDNSPKSATHFDFEYAFSCLKYTCIKHIPEVCPHEDEEKKRSLVCCHWIFTTYNC